MTWTTGLFTGTLKERADKPNWKDKRASDYDKQFQPTTGKEVPALAVHHVTDWATLRDTWNRMVTDKHWGTICCWLYAVGFDTNNVFYETQLDQSPAKIVNAMVRGADIGDVADVNEIHARVTWSTWNLVEGPKESTRTDDRGNFHDIFSNVRGLSDQERINMRAADNVYTAIAGMNLNEEVPKERALALSRAFLGVNRGASIIKFKPEMWVETAKTWRKNTM